MEFRDDRVNSFLINKQPLRKRSLQRMAYPRRSAIETLETRVLIIGTPPVSAGPQFFGPLAGWLMAPAATGNATTDTANLQNDLNLVGTAGNSNTLYISAGTYLINQSLIFRGKSEVTVIGVDPATTIIQWAGAPSTAGAQAMLVDYGNTISEFN